MVGDDDDTAAHGDEALLAPLVGLVDRLRGEVTELRGQWEALGQELDDKARRLNYAEATLELLQRQREEKVEEEDAWSEGKDEEDASQTGQASVGGWMSPSE
jgi:chromosome segregation ATPase